MSASMKVFLLLVIQFALLSWQIAIAMNGGPWALVVFVAGMTAITFVSWVRVIR